MRDHSGHIVLTTEEAVACALTAFSFERRTERVAVAEALGRVLAADVVSRVQTPNKISSCMDAVALHWAEVAEGVPTDEVAATWRRGVEWDFANTGRALPDGFDTALAIEEVEISYAADGSERVRFIGEGPRCAGDCTQAVGSKLQVGDLLAPAHALLTPLLMAAIVAGGHTHVEVVARPKVGFIPTGTELIEAAAAPQPGCTIDTNSTLVAAQVQAWGGECVLHPIIPDDYETIRAALLSMCERCDMVVINAGSSKGSDDWTMEILDEIGTVFNHETNHAPSRHSAFAQVRGTIVVGISGPAGGAAFTSEFYVRPLINRYLGREELARKVPARLVAEFAPPRPRHRAAPNGLSSKAPAGQKQFVIQHMHLRAAADGVLEAWPVPMDDAQAASAAGAYFSLPREGERPHAGDLIEVNLRWPVTLGLNTELIAS